ncbi:MAG: hypothetical protein ACK4WB_00915 [Desulfatiglandales bacterium]
MSLIAKVLSKGGEKRSLDSSVSPGLMALKNKEKKSQWVKYVIIGVIPILVGIIGYASVLYLTKQIRPKPKPP